MHVHIWTFPGAFLHVLWAAMNLAFQNSYLYGVYVKGIRKGSSTRTQSGKKCKLLIQYLHLPHELGIACSSVLVSRGVLDIHTHRFPGTLRT